MTTADQGHTDQTPTPEEEVERTTEPSTEKDPGEEPRAPRRTDAEPNHEAIGVGVIDYPDDEWDPTPGHSA